MNVEELRATLKASGVPEETAEAMLKTAIKTDKAMAEAERERIMVVRQAAIDTHFKPIQQAVLALLREQGSHAVGLKALADAGVKSLTASWGLDSTGVWTSSVVHEPVKAKATGSGLTGERVTTAMLYGLTLDETYQRFASVEDKAEMLKRLERDKAAGNSSSSWNLKTDVRNRAVKAGLLKPV